jgi:penicillin-insensitive murein DD-endopeptidase
MRRLALIAACAGLVSIASPVIAQPSQCYGTTSKGRIERSVKLPTQGDNFRTYSVVASAAGRTYVHSTVAKIIGESYQAVAKSMSEKVFVYGESGWEGGGSFRPHRTHQNGLSVDFMTPVVDAKGKSVPLPTSAMNKWGYDIEFDRAGRFDELTIDFVALAEHLYALNQAAKANQTRLSLVILDPIYFPKLFATPRGAYLKANMPFMKGKPWIRHDEHYHVDFAIPCKPLKFSKP